MRKVGVLVVMAAVFGAAGAEPLPLEAQHEDLAMTPIYGRGPAQARDPALLELCQAWAQAHHVNLYSYHQRLVGNRVALFASCVRTKDKGLVIVGTVGSEHPVKGQKPVAAFVARIDAAGTLRWSKELRKKTYKSFEGESAVEAPNGDILVATQAYANPAWFGSAWVLRFTAAGKQVWEAILPGRGAPGMGLPDTLRLVADGSVLMEGHVYPDRKALDREQTYEWTGLLDASGKLVRAEVGKPFPKN